jgi:hypothetical protein
MIARQAIRRGSFHSVRDLVDIIRPFTWTKDTDTILTKEQRPPKIKEDALRLASLSSLAKFPSPGAWLLP